MSRKGVLLKVNAYNKGTLNRVAFMPEETDKGSFFSSGSSVEEPARKHTGRLIKVSKGNVAGINKQRENLFLLGGQSSLVDDYLLQWTNNTNMQGYGMPISSNVNGKDFSFNFTNPQQNASVTKTSPIVHFQTPMQKIAQDKSTPDKTVKVDNTGLGFTVKQSPDNITIINNSTQSPAGTAGATSAIDRAKNAVTQVLGSGANMSKWDKLATNAGMSTEDYMKSTNKLGISKEANPFSKGNIGGTMKGIGAAAAAMGTEIGKSEANPRGMFDALDPVHALAGGRESAVGNAMSDAGVGVFQAGASTGQPYLMIAGAALKVLGGLSNAAFGMKENKQMKKAADESIASNRNFRSNATSFDDIKGPASMTGTNIYEGGWFSGGAAADKNAQYARDMASAYSWADRSIDTNVRNISSDQIEDFMRNYAAFGGYFDRSKRKKRRLIKR